MLAQSCAAPGPRRGGAPCDERYDEIVRVPAPPEAGFEMTGKLRVDLPRYRIRGLARIVYFPAEDAVRIDFRHSSLFGAIEEDATLLIGDSLVIEDHTRGRRFGNDSSLALVQEETGCAIGPADILAALLFGLPGCAEMDSATVSREGESWRLEGGWRGRRIEVRGKDGHGFVEFRECFAGRNGCFALTYGEPMTVPGLSYPRWIRLRREGGQERIAFELIEMKSIAIEPGMLETEETWER